MVNTCRRVKLNYQTYRTRHVFVTVDLSKVDKYRNCQLSIYQMSTGIVTVDLSKVDKYLNYQLSIWQMSTGIGTIHLSLMIMVKWVDLQQYQWVEKKHWDMSVYIYIGVDCTFHEFLWIEHVSMYSIQNTTASQNRNQPYGHRRTCRNHSSLHLITAAYIILNICFNCSRRTGDTCFCEQWGHLFHRPVLTRAMHRKCLSHLLPTLNLPGDTESPIGRSAAQNLTLETSNFNAFWSITRPGPTRAGDRTSIKWSV
jgi:hypothetical protein